MKITHLKQLLTFSVLLFSFSSFGQNFPTIIDSLICRLNGNHTVIHLVGEDAVEKTYFFDSLGRNTLIKTANFFVSDDTLEKVNLSSSQTHRLYKRLVFPESIQFDSVNHSENQFIFFYNNLNTPREIIPFQRTNSSISGDTTIHSIAIRYNTESFFYKNDSIVKFIDTFKIFSKKNKDSIQELFIKTFYVQYNHSTIFIVSDKYFKCYSIDLEKMKLKEHSMSYAYDKDIKTKFELLNEVYKRNYYKNSYQINFYNKKEEIPILSKKKRLKQYKKFHKTFPLDIQLR